MKSIIGHLHPALVHLPIGILLIACLFQWLARKEKYAALQPAIHIALFWGMISAIASCITGYMLSQSDDYDLSLVTAHQWSGISVAALSIVMYALQKIKDLGKLLPALSVAMFLLVGLTGHLGGSLTHGSDYLTKGFSGSSNETGQVIRKPIPDVQAAYAYSDLVQPLLQAKCYTCHGANKQKGKFRLDKPEFIMKGGKDGEMIIAGAVDKSKLMKRLLLPREDEDHMPPKEKSQLNEADIALLHWWIETGASFDKKVKDLAQSEKIKPVLLALQKTSEEDTQPDLPTATVDKADDDALRKLKDRGIVVVPVAQNSNYLLVNFITATGINDKDLSLLLPVKKQLAWLKLTNTKVGDSAMQVIAQCTNLVRLQLDFTNITDKGLSSLHSLTNLHSLNLVGTKVTAAGVSQLKDLTGIRYLYLYQTNVDKSSWAILKKTFPKAIVDSGGYVVPMLPSDTTEVKEAKKKPN